MKVVILSDNWVGSGGGIATFLHGLVLRLQENGINVRVIFRNGKDEKQIKINGNRFIYVIKSLFCMRSIRPDVIHSNGSWYCLMPGAIYKSVNKVKLIHTFHSVPLGELTPIGSLLFQIIISKCDNVTFVSKSLMDPIRSSFKLNIKNSEIIYAGVSAPIINNNELEDFKKTFGFKKDEIILLGQALTASKPKAEGAKLLLKALKKINANNHKVRLLLTREGAYINELRTYSENMGLDDSVIFTGDVENPFIAVEACDIFTHISLADGLPLAILEAMSLGKPIIATNVGGIPECIINEETGLLINPSIDEIVTSINRLLNDKDLALSLGSQAKKTALDTFSWEKSSSKFIILYNK